MFRKTRQIFALARATPSYSHKSYTVPLSRYQEYRTPKFLRLSMERHWLKTFSAAQVVQMTTKTKIY